MRIDLDSVAFRPDFSPQKPSGEVHEMNARGENVRGKIIDVNQNVVLIQTSTGRQFSATTTVPMENFIDQEMSFSIMIGTDGELILKPEMDDGKQRTLVDLKIEDMLSRLGRQITSENKDIIKQMMKSSISISKENFDDIKELKFAMNLLKTDNYAVKLQNGDEDKTLNNLLKEVQTRKDFGVTEKADNQILEKDADLKDILLLKNLGLKVSISNIKSLYEMLGKINAKQGDLTGINNMLNDRSFAQNLKSEVELMRYQSINISEDSEESSILKQNIKQDNSSNIEKTFKNPVFEDFGEKPKNIATQERSKDIDILRKELKSEDIMQALRNIEKNMNKKLGKNSNYSQKDLEIEYEKAKDDIKSILSLLFKDGKTSKTIERQLMPKIDMLSTMVEKYNYNIVPFKMGENYENVLQYYVKKGKKTLKEKDDINIGLSIDTRNYGNVKTMLNYDKKNTLKLDFFTEDRDVKSRFDSNMSSLRGILKALGFGSIDIKVSVSESRQDLIDNVLFDDANLKSFEMWI